jgi:hypothetical protein
MRLLSHPALGPELISDAQVDVTQPLWRDKTEKRSGMKPVTRKDQLASLQDIRLGDLPAPLYELIAELLAQFAEGTLYDLESGAGISPEVLRMFEARLHDALETVMFKQLPQQMQRLANDWIKQSKLRVDKR